MHSRPTWSTGCFWKHATQLNSRLFSKWWSINQFWRMPFQSTIYLISNAVQVGRINWNIQHLIDDFHASKPIRTTVVDTPYRGGVLCLMWWIHHTEAGYYTNVVGYYAWCGGYTIRRRGITLMLWDILLTCYKPFAFFLQCLLIWDCEVNLNSRWIKIPLTVVSQSYSASKLLPCHIPY